MKDYLKNIVNYSCVILEWVENNLGIIGGMCYCLERISGYYFLFLDFDDYFELDCVKIIIYYIKKYNYLVLLFIDEDKFFGSSYYLFYFKLDWDFVLFVNFCYIVYLCVINCSLVLDLNVYIDLKIEGSYDWDMFIRFLCVGYVFLYIFEVFYSWCMYE